MPAGTTAMVTIQKGRASELGLAIDMETLKETKKATIHSRTTQMMRIFGFIPRTALLRFVLEALRVN